MPKVLLQAAAVIALFVLAGSSRPEADEALLFVRTSGDIALVQPGGDAEAVLLPGAVASTDASTVVHAASDGTETSVTALEAESGSQLWTRQVPGNLEVKVAGHGGRIVALGAPKEGRGYPRGRTSTSLVILRQTEPEPRTIELRGNFEPEAFSTNGESLFVIQYLPAHAPSRYRVRRLDLRTQRVEGVYTVDAELQEAMRGTARVQAASPDGNRLYTLYSVESADGASRAFVHVLSLHELWAHCVDLPAGFADAAEGSIALAVAPDGRRLYVADASTGTVAEIDTKHLRVSRISDAAPALGDGTAHGVIADDLLYLAGGPSLVAIDITTLVATRRWDLESGITGIQVGNDGHVYVGVQDRIAVLDGSTGKELRLLRPTQIDRIEQLGPFTRPLDEERTELQCAC